MNFFINEKDEIVFFQRNVTKNKNKIKFFLFNHWADKDILI